MKHSNEYHGTGHNTYLELDKSYGILQISELFHMTTVSRNSLLIVNIMILKRSTIY